MVRWAAGAWYASADYQAAKLAREGAAEMSSDDHGHGVPSAHVCWQTRAMLTPGQAAPAFRLADQNDEIVDSADLAGRWVLLWWYPKAATPG